jgi:hypothetical protein
MKCHQSGRILKNLDFARKNGGREGIRTPDPLLAKQVLSQLSYTPTAGVTFILKHFPPFQNPFRCIFAEWSEHPK